MLSDEQLEIISEALQPLFQYLEKEVITDIARRIQKTLTYSRTAELQALSMKKLGYSPARIRKEAMKILNSDPEFRKQVAKNTLEYKKEIRDIINEITKEAYKANNEIVANAGTMAWISDLSVWKDAGKKLTDNSYLSQLVKAFADQTAGELKNMTQTTGFKTMNGYESIENVYKNELDKAVIKVCSGTFSQDKVLRDVVHNLAQSGLRSIDFSSGYSMQLDTAARLAVRTGCHQLSGKILDKNIEQTGENLVYVSRHRGARNTGTGHANHEQWQGKVYYIKSGHDYRNECKRIGQDYITDLWYATGYSVDGAHQNDPLGLDGYNCRHNRHPWFEGVSTFPANHSEPDPEPVTVNGKTYDYYAMTQKMRGMERGVRALKREKEALEALGMDTTEIKAKIKRRMAEYREFCKACGVPSSTSKLRYECGTSDIKKTEAWKRFHAETEKQINIGKFKPVDIQKKEMRKAGIRQKYIDNIESAVQNFSKEYEIRLNSVEVGRFADDTHVYSPIFYRADSVDGIYIPKLVVNSACEMWRDERLLKKIVSGNFFAGNNVEDFTIHELCHVLTFQDCATIDRVMELGEVLEKEYVPGISGYNDICRDGSETIAEAFISLRNGKEVPERAVQLVEKYIERWKK